MTIIVSILLIILSPAILMAGLIFLFLIICIIGGIGLLFIMAGISLFELLDNLFYKVKSVFKKKEKTDVKNKR